VAPFGVGGGLPGRTGSTRINPGSAAAKTLPARSGDVPLAAGDVLLIERPGGGGFGDPHTRPHHDVLADVREGYVTPEAAWELYGVEVTADADGRWRLNQP